MVDRRTLLLAAGVQMSGVVVLGSGTYVVARFLTPVPEGLGEEDVEIREEDLKAGEAVQLIHKGKPVLIVRDKEGNLHGLSAVCTHLACIVKWDTGDQQVKCPCHDAAFTLQGEVLGGPAPRPLTQIPLVVEEGVIKIQKKKV